MRHKDNIPYTHGLHAGACMCAARCTILRDCRVGIEHLVSFSPGASLMSISQYLRFSESYRGDKGFSNETTFIAQPARVP